ncbi:hypothetical protein DLH72_01530 [Candidatus Gracilibacteria bacterium]|nr:MAG: hypothetical protein DLH72_01530 [Candidatus Gracilibacteria bacterium]
MRQKVLKFIYQIFAIFARLYLRRTKPEIIGITGSVGKTSCRMIVSQTLEKFLTDKKIYSSPKNYNSEIGIVCSIFGEENYKPNPFFLLFFFFKVFFLSIFGGKKYDILVLEYGVDKPNDMDFLISIARPDISIFTKLDFIHVANFRDQEELGLEKSKLIFAAKKVVYLNKDDLFQTSIFSEVDIEKYFYNEGNPYFDYIFKDSKIFSNLQFNGQNVKTNLLGEENLIYLELALKILEKFGFDFSTFEEEILINFELQNGRFRVFNGIFDSILIDSSYNSGPESMKAMIKNAVKIKKDIFPDYKNLFVLGDMREIGDNSSEKHKELFEFASKYGEIISVGKETLENFGKHIGNFKYSRQAGKILKSYLEENKDEKFVILFKGSQNTIFLEEAIKEVLKNKDDEKYLVRQEKYWKKEDF